MDVSCEKSEIIFVPLSDVMLVWGNGYNLPICIYIGLIYCHVSMYTKKGAGLDI